MNFRRLLVGLSVALVIVGAALSVLMHGANPLLHPEPWYRLPPTSRELLSAATGLTFAAFVILFTRVAVRRAPWARRLHKDLRPIAQQMSPSLILALAVLSSSGEELLFRSFLTPWIGVVPQAILFGLLHQISGPSRWVWAIWAGSAGLIFGAMYEVLGSLLGPILSHGLINAANLCYLRTHDPDALA